VQVSVMLVSRFARFAKNFCDGKVELEDNSSVRDLAEKIGLPLEYVRIVLVNDGQASLETVLANNDRVTFLPPAIGGG
jgi:molybdopterin converting factor small subunit